MQIRGQLHTPVVLSPGTVGLVSSAQKTGRIPEPMWTFGSREKYLARYGIRIKTHSIDQQVKPATLIPPQPSHTETPTHTET